ncbi:MAG: hypothetical protein HQL77_17320 [Magnetococcales bacterium]|nr:hypothetical protein [Magnetococcales bacterium]
MTTDRDNLDTVMSLIRENKFDHAWDYLSSLLVTDPHLVAQWYLFSQFVTKGSRHFGSEVRGALGGVSRAATRAFDTILGELEAHAAAEKSALDDVTVKRLEAFLNLVQLGNGKSVLAGKGGKPAASPGLPHQEPLVRFLERIQQGRILNLGPAARIELRLDGLRRRMKASRLPPQPATRHRLAERLTAFGNALKQDHNR